MFYEESDLVSIPKKEHWSGAQIYHFINDIQTEDCRECPVTT